MAIQNNARTILGQRLRLRIGGRRLYHLGSGVPIYERSMRLEKALVRLVVDTRRLVGNTVPVWSQTRDTVSQPGFSRFATVRGVCRTENG